MDKTSRLSGCPNRIPHGWQRRGLESPCLGGHFLNLLCLVLGKGVGCIASQHIFTCNILFNSGMKVKTTRNQVTGLHSGWFQGDHVRRMGLEEGLE